MALFERGSRSAEMSKQKRLDDERKAALETTRGTLDEAEAAVALCSEQSSLTAHRDEAAQRGVSAIEAELARADADAVTALNAGSDVPDLTALKAQLEQARFFKRATGQLHENAADALERSLDRRAEALEAHRLAQQAELFMQLAKALAAADVVDIKLREGGFAHYGIGALIAEITAAAEECSASTPAIAEIEVYTHDLSIFRHAPDRAVDAVAKGGSFVHAKDARKYEAQVEARRAEVAAENAAAAARRQRAEMQ